MPIPWNRLAVRKRQMLPFLCLSLLLLLPACGDDNNFNSHQTNGSGNIGVNNARFTGNILFAKSGNIFVLHGKDASLIQLTQSGTAFQPALSPDGKNIVFEVRKSTNDYSDIATMPSSGGNATMITDDSLHDKSTKAPYHYLFWAANPIWSADGQNIIYLTDFFKGGKTTPIANQTCLNTSDGPNASWIQDMGIAELPVNSRPVSGGQLNDPPNQLAWPYCNAGGDQDLSLRPGVSDTEVLFTSFQYIPPENTNLGAQLSVLIIPNDGNQSQMIEFSELDAKIVPMEPSFSPDGKYITYIRRENNQDNLYIMSVDATIQPGTPNMLAPGVPESYKLIGGGTTTYSTNPTYYAASQKLADGMIGQPFWGDSNTLFFTKFDNGEFNLFMAKVKFSGQKASLDGTPVQLTQGGIDATSRPDWFQ
jgi:hypothetical protein